MKRYADPLRCPDCSGPLGHGTRACPTCGLTLTGEVAQELFTTLSRADELLASLRSVSPAEPAPVAAAVETRPTPLVEPEPAGTPPPRGLGAASVPKILLTLGAACLLVAALVFLAVTWSVMGVGGRTATLVGFTVVAGALAGWGARRGLRAAAESLALVALGLLTLDLFGARNAGWLGDLSPAGFLVLLGLVLAAVSAAGALAVRRTATGALTGAEVVTAVGTAVAGTGLVGLDVLGDAAGLVLAVLLGLGVTATTRRLRLRVATALAGVVTGGAWVALTGYALVRAGEHPTVHALWAGLEVWPLLAAAALVSSLTLLGSPAVSRVLLAEETNPLRLPVRVGAAALGYLLLVVAAAMPVLDESATAVTVAALGVLAVTGALASIARRPWGLAGALAQGVAGVAVAVVAVGLALRSVERLVAAGAGAAWTGAAGDRLPTWSETALPEPWVLPVAVAGLVGTALALAHAAGLGRVRGYLLDPLTVATVAVLTAVATLGLYPVSQWVPVAVLVVAAAAGAVAWSRHQDVVLLGLVLAALLAALVPALRAEGLTAAVLVAALPIVGALHLRAAAVEQAAAAGLVLALTTAGLVWTGGALADAPWDRVALAGLLVLGGLVLGAPAAPDRWWAGAAVPARTGLEAGAGAAAVPLGVAGALLAPVGEAATWTAVYLTVAGVVMVAMSLLRADRRGLGWAGGALLVLASWVRLQDLGVHAPEAYTLPSAVALLVVGLVHLRRAPRASTARALSPGLGLALVPSLLWALDEPVSLRALLLGIACFGLVVAGVRARWTAPLVWGALVGLLLVLRLAAPYVGQAVPRWVLIGAAGAALIAMGVTWERRLADARHLVSYVRALR